MGPYDAVDPDIQLPTFRTIGYRKTTKHQPPIAHAKLALLGNICWTDEDPVGGVTDYIWFSPKRLWVSSANFTYGSRQSLEFGYWTEHTKLIPGVQELPPQPDRSIAGSRHAGRHFDPDLADIEYDDLAIGEAAAGSYQARVELAEINGEEFDEDELRPSQEDGPWGWWIIGLWRCPQKTRRAVTRMLKPFSWGARRGPGGSR